MIFQVVAEALLMGSVYALAALGMTLIFGVMKITNFAHGAIMTVGMYVSYVSLTYFGLSPYASLPISAVVVFVLGYLIQRFFIDPIDKEPTHNQLLMTFGLSIVIENGLLAVFGSDAKSEIFEAYSKSIELFGIKVNVPRLISLFVVLAVTASIYIFLYKTNTGRGIRATSMNSDGALLMGVVVRKMKALTFGIGALCTGIAGTLLTPTINIDPTIGGSFQLTCFVIVVLGGMGNLMGALISGLIVGLAQGLTSFYLGGKWSTLVIYVIFILVLMFKPNGLFERRGRSE